MLKRYIIDSIPRLNEVFIGGLREEAMIHIYGAFQTGKSLLTIQILYEMVGKNFGNALYIDTESSILNNFGDIWLDRFRERFKYDVKMVRVGINKYVKVKGGKKKFIRDVQAVIQDDLSDLGIEVEPHLLNRVLQILLPGTELYPYEDYRKNVIYVLDGVGIDSMLKILDVDAEVMRVGDKMEVKIKSYGDLYSSPLSLFINRYKVKFIVLDSLGSLIKPLLSSLQDLPARANITNIILNSLMRLVSKYNLIAFVLNHESKAPMKNFHTFYGGASVGYGFKYNLYLKRVDKSVRELVVYRAPHLPELNWNIKLSIDEGGFHEYMEDSKESS